jgi:hypothetical protein
VIHRACCGARKLPVTTRSRRIAPSDGAGESGAATPVTATMTTHYTIITIITATTKTGFLS